MLIQSKGGACSKPRLCGAQVGGCEGKLELLWCHQDTHHKDSSSVKISTTNINSGILAQMRFAPGCSQMGGYQLMQIVLGPSGPILGQFLSQLCSQSPEYLSLPPSLHNAADASMGLRDKTHAPPAIKLQMGICCKGNGLFQAINNFTYF